MDSNQMPKLNNNNNNNNQFNPVNSEPVNQNNQQTNQINQQVVTPVISQTMVSSNNVKKKEPMFMDKHTYREFFKDVIKYISSKKSNELFALLWRFLLITGFVLVLGAPFVIIRDLVPEILITFNINFDKSGQDMINLIIVLIYVLLAIFLLFKLCKERYYNYVKNTQEINDLKQQVNNE